MNSQPVELIGIFGDDTTVAEAAWYSTGKEVTPERLVRVPEMVKMLATEKHTVPFEHTLISFRVVADIATHIHFLKHRIGVSISSQSQRWAALKEDLYYLPDDWPESMRQEYLDHMHRCFSLYHRAITEYVDAGIDRKRAKEAARFVLPYATQIKWRATFNLLSLIHFQKLRNSDHAQAEIHLIAAEMLRLVRETGKFENSLKAWGL